ncbi:hypothetical protein LJR290_001333 [Variovorax sp. LjRoot290]|uniref:hypothetical protein n=1 Tax=Variovorax sp. LjRoot290 TaxID=3342316 RepID=UPI003ECE6415
MRAATAPTASPPCATSTPKSAAPRSSCFRGKSGVLHEARLDDPRVARVVRRCPQLPGQELFQHQDEDGMPRILSSTDVNDYLREAAGDNFTAKDFRTWHGTVQALELTRLACSDVDPADASTRHPPCATAPRRSWASWPSSSVIRRQSARKPMCIRPFWHSARNWQAMRAP